MIYHTEENSQLKNSFSEAFRELKLPSLLIETIHRFYGLLEAISSWES